MKVVNLNCLEFNSINPIRNRRKRYNTQEQTLGKQKHQVTNDNFPSPKKIVFAQQVDYVMEINDGKSDQNNIKFLNCDTIQNQKKDAFKKKLRKYSHQVEQADIFFNDS